MLEEKGTREERGGWQGEGPQGQAKEQELERTGKPSLPGSKIPTSWIRISYMNRLTIAA
jgi:hypothetical protein